MKRPEKEEFSLEIRTQSMVNREDTPERESEAAMTQMPREPLRESGLLPLPMQREPMRDPPVTPRPQREDAVVPPSQDAMYGILPARAPLANPFVPFQQNNPQTYPAKQGIVRGTLFPGLNLPYLGKVNTEPLDDTPLHELQALGFALVELVEYLDTHPNDRDAFALFRSYAKLYREGREAYEKQFGPLTPAAAAEGEQYCWLRGPWPWEYRAQEG